MQDAEGQQMWVFDGCRADRNLALHTIGKRGTFRSLTHALPGTLIPLFLFAGDSL
jgi:hypothetical protein